MLNKKYKFESPKKQNEIIMTSSLNIMVEFGSPKQHSIYISFERALREQTKIKLLIEFE